MLSKAGPGVVGKLVRRAGWLTLAQYLAALVGLGTTVLVSRLLGPEQFGLVALTTSYTTLMWGFISFKAASVTTRYIAGYHASGDVQKLGAVCKLGYGIDLATALVVTVIVGASAGLFAQGFLNKPFLAPFIVISVMAMPLYALTGTSRTVLMSLDRVDLAAGFVVAEKTVILVCTALALTVHGVGFESVIVAQAVGQALVGAAMAAVAWRLLRKRGVNLLTSSVRQVSEIFQDIRKLFAWNYLHTTVSTAFEQLPVLLLGRYESAAAAGIYKIATSLSVIFGYAEAALRRVSYPEFARQRVSFSGSQLLSFSSSLGRKIGIPLAAMTIIALLAVYWLVPLLFGQLYAASIPAAQVLMLAAGVSGYAFWVEAYYFTMGALRIWTLQYIGVSLIGSSIMFYLLSSDSISAPIIVAALISAVARISFVALSLNRTKRI